MKRLDGSWRPTYLGRGATREVILIWRYAIKIPKLRYGWRPFLSGLLANLQERDFGKAGWPELCPVVFSLPGGWLVVMRRAEPMTSVLADKDWFAFNPEKFCKRNDYWIPAEYKGDSFGKVDGRIVAVDYG